MDDEEDQAPKVDNKAQESSIEAFDQENKTPRDDEEIKTPKADDEEDKTSESLSLYSKWTEDAIEALSQQKAALQKYLTKATKKKNREKMFTKVQDYATSFLPEKVSLPSSFPSLPSLPSFLELPAVPTMPTLPSLLFSSERKGPTHWLPQPEDLPPEGSLGRYLHLDTFPAVTVEIAVYVAIFCIGSWFLTWWLDLAPLEGVGFLASLSLLGFALRGYMRLAHREKPVIYYHDEVKTMNFLISRTWTLFRDFEPALFSISRHVQTAMFAFWPGFNALATKVVHERDFAPPRFGKTLIALDWMKDSASLPADAPIVILLPGVHGSSTDMYIRRNQLLLIQVGLRSVVKSWRGLGCELGDELGETWGQESVWDMAATVDHIKRKYPQAKAIFGIGWSVGGHLLQCYLGTEHGALNLLSGVSISGLFSFNDLVAHCESTVFPYNFVNVSVYKALSRPNLKLLGAAKQLISPTIDVITEMEKCTLLREMHRVLICPFYAHYPTPTDLYNSIHSLGLTALKNIRTPLLCMMSNDDPLCPPQMCARAFTTAMSNPAIAVATTTQGGHCGWFEGARGESYVDRVSLDWILACLKLKEITPVPHPSRIPLSRGISAPKPVRDRSPEM